MTEASEPSAATSKRPRRYPRIKNNGHGNIEVEAEQGLSFPDLMGTQTEDAARLLLSSAVAALGEAVEPYAALPAAMFAELEPRDAVEAMLVAQMTVTHVALTKISEKMSYQTSTQIRESLERSMTRLSRTYLAQMDALKKYRAKAQQVVRVERVTVEGGGQAIVGDVTHTGGRGDGRKRR